ncbi:hypothetical protein C6P46_000772 [Rhodotorula mucilaginosa]|uniref:Transcription regulator Rua1 C-terminal domain-containing protein n=1 Tax=Rhodotorula mucilaginosa TaxID=5537 RepID=A0A9P6VUX7_RHOMI|nr:hypothetical protein C6P46_000772 [Rhodotorula mucilaginosa]TKA51373.1 hypothetical protein B0A53_05304 [Rhodotorula sp. CCFEE 5036]
MRRLLSEAATSPTRSQEDATESDQSTAPHASPTSTISDGIAVLSARNGISAKSNSPPSLAASESFETIAPFDETLPGQTFHRTFLVDGGKWTFRAPYVPATDVFSPRWLRQFSTPIGATLPPEALCVYCSFDETIAWSTLPGARGWYDLEGMAWSDHLVVRHGISPFFRGYFAPPAVLRKSCMTSMFCMQLDDGYCRTCGEWVTAAAMWTVPEAGYGSQLTADWRMWWRHASECHADATGGVQRIPESTWTSSEIPTPSPIARRTSLSTASEASIPSSPLAGRSDDDPFWARTLVDDSGIGTSSFLTTCDISY